MQISGEKYVLWVLGAMGGLMFGHLYDYGNKTRQITKTVVIFIMAIIATYMGSIFKMPRLMLLGIMFVALTGSAMMGTTMALIN